jgi:uncharacterized protein YdhG (YjbR/CyaY superfamily)
MAQSTAKSVDDYIASLPADRREIMTAVRKTVRKHLPKGYEEGMHYGMINYFIPFSRFPETYNGQPLCYVGLAAQKNHFALYLMGAYGSAESASSLKEGFKRAGKKLDMGKSCVRFKNIDDLALDAIAESIASIAPDDYIALYERSRLMTKAGAKKAAAKSAARKPAARRATRKR